VAATSPSWDWIRGYQWGAWLRLDVIAGISVAALLIPESLGYAGVAGLPPEVGLYAAPLALLGYAIWAARRFVVATSASTAAVQASVIAEINGGGGSDSALALSAALALFTGVALLAVGLAARLGRQLHVQDGDRGLHHRPGNQHHHRPARRPPRHQVTGENSFEESGVLTQTGLEPGDRHRGCVSLALLFGLERFVKKLPPP
jgi:hypothetical protein